LGRKEGAFCKYGGMACLSWPSWPVMGEGERERDALIGGVGGTLTFWRSI